MRREHGKQVWSRLLKCSPQPDAIAVSDPGDGLRALSLATAVAEVFGLRREEAIYHVGAEEAKVTKGTAPPCPRVYDTARQTRAAVM
jgi:hypothetical protein